MLVTHVPATAVLEITAALLISQMRKLKQRTKKPSVFPKVIPQWEAKPGLKLGQSGSTVGGLAIPLI